MPYQSFGSSRGDSDSLQKLICLRLPTLKNKSFLDVGCNTGFFSGYAKFMGATRVLGVDSSGKFIDNARALFPTCEFLCADWSDLPAEEFDVILVASALHYSKDPISTLDMLMSRLAPGGTLVLEYGVLEEPGGSFIEVRRPVGDVVMHAQRDAVITFAHSRQYLYRRIGKSVNQSEDPTDRYVVHLDKPKCSGIVINGLPTTGKSHLTKKIKKTTDTIIDLDEFLVNSSKNPINLSTAYSKLIAKLDIHNLWPTYQEIENDAELRHAFWEELTRKYPFDSDFIITGALGNATVAKLIFELSAHGVKMTHIETQHYRNFTNYEDARSAALEYNASLMQK
jgi:SAM-dependent methyltransferase